MPIRRLRQTGTAVRRPVEIERPGRGSGSRAVARLPGAASERKGYTEAFVKDLVEKRTVPGTRQTTDPYSDYYSPSGVSFYGHTYLWPIQPTYSFQRLCELVVTNNSLGLCIDAYVTNIESYGYVLEYIGPEGQEDRPRVQAEKANLEIFLQFVSPDHSLREVRELARRDRETMGNCFYEVSRNQKGEIVLFDHIPAITMRVTRKDPTPVEVEIELPDPSGGYIRHKVLRYFRRFCQITPTLKKVYFKQLGDPRPIDPTTGEVNEELAIEDQATEVLWGSNYTPGFLYGLPRWIGQLPSILGSRESEMVNLNFFRENAIPAMVVLVSGGALTGESYDKLLNYVNAVRGQRSMNRVMLLEAQVDDNMGGLDHSQPAPRIDIKPMISERQQDGLFQDYDVKTGEKIRSSMRLPPLYAGRAQDYTRASAFASMQVADTQIFIPERSAFDEIFNRQIFGTYKPRYYRFKSIGPSMVDADSISKMIKALGDQGGMTPNIAIKMVNQVLNVQVQPITDEWGDYPFDLLLEYVRSGAEIKGMDDFVEAMGQVIDAENRPPPKSANNVVPLKTKKPTTKRDVANLIETIKEEFSGEMAEIVDSLIDARLEALQVA